MNEEKDLLIKAAKNYLEQKYARFHDEFELSHADFGDLFILDQEFFFKSKKNPKFLVRVVHYQEDDEFNDNYLTLVYYDEFISTMKEIVKDYFGNMVVVEDYSGINDIYDLPANASLEEMLCNGTRIPFEIIVDRLPANPGEFVDYLRAELIKKSIRILSFAARTTEEAFDFSQEAIDIKMIPAKSQALNISFDYKMGIERKFIENANFERTEI